MTDWIGHTGGPQPVDDDVWICIDAMPEEMEEVGAGYVRLPKQVGSWKHVTGFFVINQHLIDAALKRGIELGLEAAAKEAGARRWRWSTWENHPRMSQWAKSVQSAYEHCEFLIRALNPDTIARDVQTISHQEKCDDLHIAREATERRIKELVEESLVAARDREQLEAEIIEAMLGGPTND